MLHEYSDCWGTCNQWHREFISEQFLLIGYHAWKGFQQFGRGMVVCMVDLPLSGVTMQWQFNAQFIAAGQSLALCLLEFDLNKDTVMMLLQAIDSYDPHQEIVLLTSVNHEVEVNWLHNLAIAPHDCYQQVCNRWDEFSVSLMSKER